MKKSLLLLSVFAAASSFAQADFTNANAPENGTYTLYVCDSFASNMATVKGTGVTWDYSDLARIDGETKSIIFDSVASVDFPTANISYDIEAMTTDFWNSSATERIREGLVLFSPDLGTVTSTFDTDPATLMTFPFAFEDNLNDTFEGVVNSSLAGDMPATGVHFTEYDGYGTLKVGVDVIPNVSRIRYVDTIHASTGFIGDIDVILEQFEYYDLDNSNEPVFIHTAGAIYQQGSTTPMIEYSLVVSKYEPTEIYSAVATKNITKVDFNLAPNPVKDELFVKGAFENATVQIIDQTGKVVYNGTASNGSVISTSNLDNGIYVVKATVDNQTVTQKIVKL